jgi:flagellar hook-associated protein 1 FlgK
MSLFSSIQMAGNALQANDICLQVTGQNISNANTPGYICEEANLVASAPEREGNLVLGTGVQVQSVTENIDAFLDQRLRGATSDQYSADSLESTYSQLETIVGAISNSNLGTALSSFFSSINDILNQPGDTSVRNLAVLQGESLATTINQMATQVESLRSDTNTEVTNMASEINDLTSQIGSLNLQIENVQGGDTSGSDAVGLEDQRLQALQSLSQLIGIQTTQQTNGSISVSVNGEFLVSDGVVRNVETSESSNGGQTVTDLCIQGTDTPLNSSSGQLAGLLQARDTVLPGFLDNLNGFAGTLISEFNKVYSSGQGLDGFTTVTSESAVDDPNAALNATGLNFTPANGSFQVLVYDKTTGLTQTSNISVDLKGQGQDMTLTQLAAELNSVSGISASIGTDNRLTITSTSPNQEFSFANDTSGVLTSLGINTFFSGSTASDIGVNSYVQNDPSLFAASQGGIGADTDNAVQLTSFPNTPLASQNGNSITDLYNNMVNDVTQGSAQAQSTATSADAYATSLSSQELATSGVSIDTETIKMLGYQEAYQASAKYISTLDSLLQLLTQL